MNVLLIHQNFPGQYLHIARHLGAAPGNRVIFLTQCQEGVLPGVQKLVYRPRRPVTTAANRDLREFEEAVLNAQEVARIAIELRASGFFPDVILGHSAWGEFWHLKDIFPAAPLVGYFEFFYRFAGADIGFDPSVAIAADAAARLRTRNSVNFLALDAVDLGVSPTHWQKSGYPKVYQPTLQVIHDGIDSRIARPNPAARLRISRSNLELSAGDEVVTYVARNLEPYRGFPIFMRSLPKILAARPKSQVVIVGGDEVSYGAPLPDGQTYKQQALALLNGELDLSRVHFLGRIPHSLFIEVLQVSRVHVYLTYPFVLSWSMLEAMSAGCLLVGSRTAPVAEVISHASNGLLVDFFSHDEVAARVIEALENGPQFDFIRRNARETILDRYDLSTICLPAHLRLLRSLLPGA
jgi:glycosyltransferase involved in cell wall biosynthesis